MSFQIALATDGKDTYLFLYYGDLKLNYFMPTTVSTFIYILYLLANYPNVSFRLQTWTEIV